jgi:antitoxin HicB
MSVYLALIHKDPNSSYGVSFPDLPGHITAGDTVDEAIANAHDLLHLLKDTWREDSDSDMPKPSNFDALRAKLKNGDLLDDAVVVAVSTDYRPSFKVAAE